MALSNEIILERLTKPTHNSQIDLAILHEEKVRFCTKKYFDTAKPGYLTNHLSKVASKLPKDKYDNYVNELSLPLPINSVADVIYSDLYKVWDSDSRTIEGSFSSPGYKQDFDQFLEDSNFIKFFQKDAWEAYKTQPNCILTIDMPVNQASYYPEPYINIVDVSRLVCPPTLDKGGNILDILYYVDQLTAIGIDEVAYYVYRRQKVDDQWLQDGEPIPHGLYWCPATFLVQDSLDSNNKFFKESAITKCLYDFEKLLFRIISGENLEDYASYPIHVKRGEDCTYEDHNGQSCQGGVINISNHHGELVGGTYACPACSTSKLNGAGTVYEIYATHKTTGDEFDLENSVKIISADVTSLDYKDKSIDNRKQTIIAACSGQSMTALSGQAQNEKQITSIFQSQESIIRKVQDNFEAAIKFCLDAIGTLRYGEIYTGSTVDLGSTHYLLSDTEIQERIKLAKEDDAPQYQISMLWDELNHTKYKSNPRMLQRANILKRLEPLPYLSTEQAIALYTSGMLAESIFYLKYNFVTLVAKFEDLNGDIVDFGIQLTLNRKIEIIQNELNSYVSETIKSTVGSVRQQGREEGVSN